MNTYIIVSLISLSLITYILYKKGIIPFASKTTKAIKIFTLEINKSVKPQEVLSKVAKEIKKHLDTQTIHICIKDKDNYNTIYTDNILSGRDFAINGENPLMLWFKNNEQDHVTTREFKKSIEYKSMTEEEKFEIFKLNPECFLDLKNEEEIVGIFILGKKKKGKYNQSDIDYILSILGVASIALKNAQLHEKSKKEGKTDELTGLYNRKYFYEIIRKEYERSIDNVISLILVDLDNFKLYNQLYGNKKGDVLLQNISNIVKEETAVKGHCARVSGKEFAIILPECETIKAQELAKNIRQKIMELNKISQNSLAEGITASIGICTMPTGASTIEELIHNVDLAVYSVKRKGKNSIKVFEIETSVEENELRKNTNVQQYNKIIKNYNEYEFTINALTAAIDAKDHYTFTHSNNVAYYGVKLGESLGLSKEYLEIIREASLLHDIGKIAIHEEILNKPGKLTIGEYETIKTHVEESINIIKHLPSLDYVIPAVTGHHERWDGKGYPRKIREEEIPLFARILCIADSFDAMISRRVYKEAMSLNRALEILQEESGKQFDPNLTKVFIEAVEKKEIIPNYKTFHSFTDELLQA